MAGNSELIDELVDPIVKKQVSDLQDQLEALDKKLVDTAKSAIVLNTATGNSKSFSDYNKTVQNAGIAQEKLRQELNKTATTATNLTKAQNALAAQTARQTAQQEKAAEAAKKALSPYQQLSKELDNMRAKAKDIAVQFGTNSKEFIAAQKPVVDLDNKLKGIDKTLGQSQRNVGNYAHDVGSALSLFSEQLDRIVPGAGNFARTVVEGFNRIGESAKKAKDDTRAFTQGGFGFKPVNVDAPSQIVNTEATAANTAAVEANAEANTVDAAAIARKDEATKVSTVTTKENAVATEEGSGFLEKLGVGMAGFTTVAFVAAIGAATYYLSQFRSTTNTVSTNLAGLKNVIANIGGNIVNRVFGDPTDAEKARKELLKSMSLMDRLKYQLSHPLRAGVDPTESFKTGKAAEAVKIQLANMDELEEAENSGLSAEAERNRALSKDKKLDITVRQQYLKDAQAVEQKILDNQKKNADKTIEVAIQLSQKLKKLNPDQLKALRDSDPNKAFAAAQSLSLNGQQFTSEGFEVFKQGIQKKIAYQEGATNELVRLQSDADNMELRADRGLAQAQSKLDRDKLQGQLDAAKLIMDNENATFDQRLKASAIYVQKSKQLAKIQLNDDLETADIGGRGGTDARTTAIQKQDAYVQYQNTINKITAEGLTQRQSIQKTESEKLKQNLTDLENFQKAQVENNIGEAKDASDQLLQIMQDQFEKEAQLVNKKYAEGKLSQKQAQDDYLKLEDQYNIDRLGQEVFLQQQILEVKQAAENRDVAFAQGNGASSAQISEIKSKSGVAQQTNVVAKAGSELNKAVGKQDVDNTKSGIDDQKEALQEFNAFAGQSSKAVDIAQTLEDNHYKAQLELLEQKKQLIQDTAKEEINAINTSIQSSADKQRKINLINAQASQQQQQLIAQENKIKQKQAIADKEANVAKIIMGTAVAVVNALAIPVFGEALAVVIGALGAAELAVAISTPLPKYAKGTGNHPGGAFIWGELGSEIAIEPSGKTYMSPDRASLGMAPAGTKIIPNHMIRPDKLSYAGGQQVPWKEVIAAINRSKPEPQKRPNVKVTVNNDSYYQKFYK